MQAPGQWLASIKVTLTPSMTIGVFTGNGITRSAGMPMSLVSSVAVMGLQ